MKDCWAEVYVENLSGVPVWFDDLEIQTGDCASAVVVQEVHYDPWGLELAGIGYIADPTLEDKFTYNGKEKVDDLALNWLDYGARNYDARLGRWWSVDPLAHKFAPVSPYNYALNNPLRFIDPTGMEVTDNAMGRTTYTGAEAVAMGELMQARQRERGGKEDDLYQQNVTMTYSLGKDGSHTLSKATEYKKFEFGKGKTTYSRTLVTEQVVTKVGEDGEISVSASQTIASTTWSIDRKGGRKWLTGHDIAQNDVGIEELDGELRGYQVDIHAQLTLDKTWNPYKGGYDYPGKTYVEAVDKVVASYGILAEMGMALPKMHPVISGIAYGWGVGIFLGEYARNNIDWRGRSATIYHKEGRAFNK